MSYLNLGHIEDSDFRCQEILAPDATDLEIRSVQNSYRQDWAKQKRQDILSDLPILN